jgi:integrase
MSNSVATNPRRTGPARGAPATPDVAKSLYGRDGGRKYLNAAERARALAVMTTLPADEALFALTLAWTGARISEVLALTPASFQIESGIVAFTTLKRRRHHVREVPIPPFLVQQLEAHFDLTTAQLDLDLVGRRLWPWHRTTGWRLIRKVMIKAQIVGRQASPRGLRHAFGVGALQAGVPINLVQRWLGHSRLSTTAIYVDASGREERKLAERFWRRN